MTLGTLRQTPQQAMANTIYYLEPSQAVTVPTRCVVGQQGSQHPQAFCVLTMVAAPGVGIDYFFPYRHGVPQGMTVPANPMRGAIAITTGMNGCALEVVFKNGNYVFYHDRNASSMGSVAVPGGVGTICCRIGPDSYWDATWANQVFSQQQVPQYQFVCVFVGNFWHVGCFRVASNNAGTVVHSGGPGLGPNIGSSYVGYFNQSIRLMRP